MFLNKYWLILLLFLPINLVCGSCPYPHRHQLYDVSSSETDVDDTYDDYMSREDNIHVDNNYNDYLSREDNIQDIHTAREDDIREKYMSSPSYDTYDTACHRFVPQPPMISEKVFDNALSYASGQSQRYAWLDDKVIGESAVNVPRFLQDMDRNNYFFDSATKYVQQATCTSKSTTIAILPTHRLDQLELFENATKVNCDNGEIEYPSCSHKNRYRNADGTCNNLERPLDGRVGDCMRRLLPPDFKDGISQFRTSLDGSPLPNSRLISTKLLGQDDVRPLSSRYTQLHSFLGEFVISDNAMNLNSNNGMRINIRCCDSNDGPHNEHPQCASIFIPTEDDVSSQEYPHQNCMEFVRSIPCARCRLGPRMMSNSVTAAQDLNSVYGVSTSMLNARRTFVDGCLKSQIERGEELFALERINKSGRYRCFNGECELSPLDARNVLLKTGQVWALLFHRNHNRHARILASIKPHWNDEEIFQEARKWNIAQYQHCVYNEYVATLIGSELIDYFDILPKPLGQFSEYDQDVRLKSIAEFQTTAGRNGHAALVEDIFIIEPNNGHEFKISFRQSELFESIFYDGHVSGMFLAQMTKPAFETTPSVPFKSFSFGFDLGSLDIQRQRDHGIPGYVNYLNYCHNFNVNYWEDLQHFIDPDKIEKIQQYYKYVQDVDLYVGGHYERTIADGVVGPTFACIIAIQFRDAKYGDRFFYEHSDQIHSFAVDQLNEIKAKSSLGSILCKNTDLNEVLSDPLRVKSDTNQFVSCSSFDDIDYMLT